MGFAEAWTHAAGAPFQPPTPRDKLDTMDTIRPVGSSVHTVHSVHKGLTPGGPANSVHTVHIVHRGSTLEDLGKGASAPGLDATGLGWLPGPPDDADPAFPSWWAALDLQDIGRCFGVRIVRAGERVLAVYPPGLAADLVDAASEVLDEARPFLRQHMNKLPILTQAEAVKIILDIMRQHKGLRFCRGDGGSRWPLYPKTWTVGQKTTVQALWFAAGPTLDRDDFKGIDAG